MQGPRKSGLCRLTRTASLNGSLRKLTCQNKARSHGLILPRRWESNVASPASTYTIAIAIAIAITIAITHNRLFVSRAGQYRCCKRDRSPP
jgi:hypothetical protein